MRRNWTASRADVEVSAGSIHAEEEVEGRHLSNTKELVNDEDGGHGNQRPDVAVAVALDRPCYLSINCYGSYKDVFWNTPENRDRGTVEREGWY